MTKEELLQAGVDYDAGLARFLNKAELYEKFVRQFPEDPSFAQLKEALASGDVKLAFQSAHTLKGVSGNLSFQAFQEALHPVLEALRAGELEQARASFPSLTAEYKRLCSAIQK